MRGASRLLMAVGLLSGSAAALPTRVPADEVGPRRVVGVAGCTAASCHGGNSLVGGEATAWLTRDAAHRRAYDVLFNEASVRMAQWLGLKAAHTEARCLACHSQQTPGHETGERFAVEFGVGCESCHGAAGNWVARHTERTWKTLSALQKSEWGFHDLRSLSTRAEKCAECHVGSPRATVDHDLIAAGHPRLTFELSAYHAMLPKHWDSTDELRRDPLQELRLWAMGHGASAKAQSEIVAARAKSAIRTGATHVVADLAEFDCHSCHHDLAEPPRGRPARRDALGTPHWGSWFVAPALIAARESQATFGQDGRAAETSLVKLRDLLQQSRLGSAPAEPLLQSAQRASRDVADWLRSLEFAPVEAARTQQWLQRLLAAESDAEWLPTWDGQAQRYLAVVAAHRSLTGVSERPILVTQTLAEFPERLRFPPGYATPRGFSGTKLQSLFQSLREGPQSAP